MTMRRILGVDVGTTSMKMGVFDEREDTVTLVSIELIEID